jgi:AcrR family transcriptional regulator
MSTKEMILKTAVKYFSKGYENTSLEEIAKELNITKPAIYYHFKNKKTLYNEIFMQKFREFNFEFENDLEKNMAKYIDTLFDFFKDKDFAKIFLLELSSGFVNLEDETKKTISVLLKTVTKILKGLDVNPLFVQTTIISSILMYKNTYKAREDILKILGENFESEFNLKEELKVMILNYLKVKQ